MIEATRPAETMNLYTIDELRDGHIDSYNKAYDCWYRLQNDWFDHDSVYCSDDIYIDGAAIDGKHTIKWNDTLTPIGRDGEYCAPTGARITLKTCFKAIRLMRKHNIDNLYRIHTKDLVKAMISASRDYSPSSGFNFDCRLWDEILPELPDGDNFIDKDGDEITSEEVRELSLAMDAALETVADSEWEDMKGRVHSAMESDLEFYFSEERFVEDCQQCDFYFDEYGNKVEVDEDEDGCYTISG